MPKTRRSNSTWFSFFGTWGGGGGGQGGSGSTFHIGNPLDGNGDSHADWEVARPNSEMQPQGAGVIEPSEWSHIDNNESYSGNVGFWEADHRPFSSQTAEDREQILWSDDFGNVHQYYNTVNDPTTWLGHTHLRHLIHFDNHSFWLAIKNPTTEGSHQKDEYYDIAIRFWVTPEAQLTEQNIETLTDSWTTFNLPTGNETLQFTMSHSHTAYDTWYYQASIGSAATTWFQDRVDNGDKIGFFYWEFDY